jgi:hypothetical protein
MDLKRRRALKIIRAREKGTILALDIHELVQKGTGKTVIT